MRVSYDTTTTRLHAKAWLFHRRSGHSTAHIGSSNVGSFGAGGRARVERGGVGGPQRGDEIAAVTLKAFAATVRRKDTDIVDIWRCLEVALAAGVGPEDFEEPRPAEAARIIRELFGDRQGRGIQALVAAHGPSGEGADGRFTRVLGDA